MCIAKKRGLITQGRCIVQAYGGGIIVFDYSLGS